MHVRDVLMYILKGGVLVGRHNIAFIICTHTHALSLLLAFLKRGADDKSYRQVLWCLFNMLRTILECEMLHSSAVNGFLMKLIGFKWLNFINFERSTISEIQPGCYVFILTMLGVSSSVDTYLALEL